MIIDIYFEDLDAQPAYVNASIGYSVSDSKNLQGKASMNNTSHVNRTYNFDYFEKPTGISLTATALNGYLFVETGTNTITKGYSLASGNAYIIQLKKPINLDGMTPVLCSHPAAITKVNGICYADTDELDLYDDNGDGNGNGNGGTSKKVLSGAAVIVGGGLLYYAFKK